MVNSLTACMSNPPSPLRPLLLGPGCALGGLGLIKGNILGNMPLQLSLETGTIELLCLESAHQLRLALAERNHLFPRIEFIVKASSRILNNNERMSLSEVIACGFGEQVHHVFIDFKQRLLLGYLDQWFSKRHPDQWFWISSLATPRM